MYLFRHLGEGCRVCCQHSGACRTLFWLTSNPRIIPPPTPVSLPWLLRNVIFCYMFGEVEIRAFAFFNEFVLKYRILILWVLEKFQSFRCCIDHVCVYACVLCVHTGELDDKMIFFFKFLRLLCGKIYFILSICVRMKQSV